MNDLKFSVAITVYKNDKAEFFDRALYSITEGQSICPDEIVLVTDGPVSEEIDAVIEKYTDTYNFFKVIRLEKNGGLGNALKIAVENASYDIIARMDSDDISLPNRFEQQLAYFSRDSKLDIISGDITEFIDYESNVVGKRCVPVGDAEIKDYLKIRCPFNHMAVMFKKQSVLSAGGYLDMFWNEDYYLWIRMAEKDCKMQNTGTVLVNVRTGKDMYKRRGGKRYFESEKTLQKYMLEHKMINHKTYWLNVSKRLIVQRCLPNAVRGWVFRKFARK